jgi:2-polyprenyl-3-methyl-5-hydroxy-6-metoxy-1,4-benzoquinol methylase
LENETMEDYTNLFDAEAVEAAATWNKQIASGRYLRGNMFLNAAVSSVPSNGYILDYGCGPGRISAMLARRGFRVLGLDPSPGMIAMARQQPLDALQVEFQLSSTCPVEAQQEAYDGVVCSSVIEYAPDPEEFLRRFFTALRPNGVLIISFANSPSFSRAWYKFRYSDHYRAARKHTWSWRQFSRLLKRSGFRPIQDPVFFRSIFDGLAPLRFLPTSRFDGALGLVVAVKDELGPEAHSRF